MRDNIEYKMGQEELLVFCERFREVMNSLDNNFKVDVIDAYATPIAEGRFLARKKYLPGERIGDCIVRVLFSPVVAGYYEGEISVAVYLDEYSFLWTTSKCIEDIHELPKKKFKKRIEECYLEIRKEFKEDFSRLSI